MGRHLLNDDLWETVQSIIPQRVSRSQAGRPPLADRDVLTGILFVLKTGIAWEELPGEIQCGSGMTCLRRLREWQADGTWPKIRRIIETHSRVGRQIDWVRAERKPRRARRSGTVCEPVF